MDDPILKWLDHELALHPLLSGPYFLQLLDGRMSRETFVATQRQFFFAVRHFSRPMAALTARMPSSNLRMELIHNLAEEHGLDEANGSGLIPGKAHDQTFLRFLESVGIPAESMSAVPEGTAVRAFNVSLMGICMAESTGLAFACLGIIELAFADIASRIGSTVVNRGWVKPSELVHYRLHAEIDRRHAAGFFSVVRDGWNRGGIERDEVEVGVRLGLHLFDRLYTDLLREADPLPS